MTTKTGAGLRFCEADRVTSFRQYFPTSRQHAGFAAVLLHTDPRTKKEFGLGRDRRVAISEAFTPTLSFSAKVGTNHCWTGLKALTQSLFIRGLIDMKQSSARGGASRKHYSTTPAKSGQFEENCRTNRSLTYQRKRWQQC